MTPAPTSVSNALFFIPRHQKKDVRTQGMVPLDELFLPPPVPSAAQAKGKEGTFQNKGGAGNNQSSPSKSSRSVSSSPTSTLRTPRYGKGTKTVQVN